MIKIRKNIKIVFFVILGFFLILTFILALTLDINWSDSFTTSRGLTSFDYYGDGSNNTVAICDDDNNIVSITVKDNGSGYNFNGYFKK